MDKTYTTKDKRGKTEGGLIWKKRWNEGFDYARWMMVYD